MNIPTKIEPFSSVGPQPDSVHLSQHELAIAHQAQGLWYRWRGNRKVYFWDNADVAPYVQIAAINTWYAMGLGAGTCDFQVPWSMQKVADKMSATAIFAVGTYQPFIARLTSQTLITAVANIDGPQSAVVTPTAGVFNVPRSPWNRTDIKYFSAVKLRLTPTLPADRRIAIGIDVRWPAYTNPDTIGNFGVKCWLYSLMINDEFPIPE